MATTTSAATKAAAVPSTVPVLAPSLVPSVQKLATVTVPQTGLRSLTGKADPEVVRTLEDLYRRVGALHQGVATVAQGLATAAAPAGAAPTVSPAGAVNQALASAVSGGGGGGGGTGGVTEPFPLLTSPPTAPTDDTWWAERDGTSPTQTVSVFARIGGVTYTIASITR